MNVWIGRNKAAKLITVNVTRNSRREYTNGEQARAPRDRVNSRIGEDCTIAILAHVLHMPKSVDVGLRNIKTGVEPLMDIRCPADIYYSIFRTISSIGSCLWICRCSFS